jgi:hypothetical protein
MPWEELAMRIQSWKVRCLALVALVCATTASAQVWEKKEYTKWSKGDCEKILRDSPWASSYTIGTVVMQAIARDDVAAVPGRESAPQVTYAAQFWSAKPIRQAMVRLQQLQAKYDKMTPEQKKVFDDRSAQFLNLEFPDQIVIQVTYSGTQAFMLSVSRFWKQKTEGDLAQSFTLVTEGKRIAPVKVIVSTGGGNEMQLLFPRRVNDEPFITPNSKEVRLEIDDPNETVRIPFKVKGMKVGEQLIY